MVQFVPFEVERWMDTYETQAKYDLAETCALSIPLQDLLQWSEEQDGEPPLHVSDVFTKKAGYGHIAGSPGLRANVAACYSKDEHGSARVAADDVLVTQGAIGANFLAILGTVQAGDDVVVVSPSYQQLQELPRSFGANVKLWQLDFKEGWKHNINDFEALLTKETRLVVINNPNNPTGSVIAPSTLKAMHACVKAKAAPDAIILSDEVYSPLWHSIPEDTERPGSILEIDVPKADLQNVVVTGSMSKAYALAGLRVGWIVTSNKKLREKLAGIRDYNVISVSGVDDELARRALNPGAKAKLLERNMHLAQTNRAILADWIERCKSDTAMPNIDWIPPLAGNTTLIYLGDGIDDVEFCTELVTKMSVNVVPAGLCFGQKGFVRIGFVGDTEVLKKGLELKALLLKEYVQRQSTRTRVS